mmetsp:Transcript_71883/g.211097  ORF Transcript_71883/g.211097 Transcript_71883/m.211097 type:complete len:137 (+) Transcript_71883:78-488(+)
MAMFMKCCCAEDGGTEVTVEPVKGLQPGLPPKEPLGQDKGKAGGAQLPSTREFRITLLKGQDQKIGLDIAHTGSVFLKVKNVKDGLVKTWNQTNPDQAIKLNDMIVEVNGVKGSSEKLLTEISQAATLDILVNRAA